MLKKTKSPVSGKVAGGHVPSHSLFLNVREGVKFS